MTTKQKVFIVLGVFAFLAMFTVLAALAFNLAQAAEFPQQSARLTAHATSTTYSLTAGSAQRIVATSTRERATALIPATTGRTALTLQAINCGTSGNIWLGFNDTVPTVNTGVFLGASTTITLADTLPMANGSIRALATTANCALLVTEFRSEY